MQIINRLKIDKQGRITLTTIFEQVPKMVVCSVDPRTKELIITDYHKFKGKNNESLYRVVDPKNRIFLPKWIRDLTNDSVIYVATSGTDFEKIHLLLKI